MTLEEMELELARIDLIIGNLKKQVTERTNPQAAKDMARYLQWRNNLDVRIGLEQIKQGTYSRSKRPQLHS